MFGKKTICLGYGLFYNQTFVKIIGILNKKCCAVHDVYLCYEIFGEKQYKHMHII